MADPFATMSTGIDGPANNAAVVTPSDGTDLATASRGLLIGAAGDIAVDMVGGQTNVVMTVPAGPLPIRVKRIRATGTTATGIVALW